MYIAYSSPAHTSGSYATLVESYREGTKVKQRRVAYLGRVIDRERGIFKNPERGIFRYTLEGGYQEVDPEEIEDLEENNIKSVLDFGDSFVLHQYSLSLPFYSECSRLIPAQKDTLFSLLQYRVLTGRNDYEHIGAWWSGSYAKVAYPIAALTSLTVSRFLTQLGDIRLQNRFFPRYLSSISGENAKAVVADNTWLGNLPAPTPSQGDSAGEGMQENRLLYAVDQRSGMPLAFSYNPGKDDPLGSFQEDLSRSGASVEYVIADPSHVCGDYINGLYLKSVPFVARSGTNLRIYEEAASAGLEDLFTAKYALRFDNRLIYLKKVPADLYGNPGFAYLGADMDSRIRQFKQTMFQAMDDHLPAQEIDRRMARLGTFLLLSSRDLDTKEVLPLYASGARLGQAFGISSFHTDPLSPRPQEEAEFRGRLMLDFLAEAVLTRLRQDLSAKKGGGITPDHAFQILRNQKCRMYETIATPDEPTKEVREIYRMLNISLQTSVPLKS